ncbi:hypothetical protein BX666DRAFT_1986867 [Dichotomocladium elegans]|nr:hypothetical protein BX666DRAFT_1986867 [Dichotomocladium elegans]
MTGSDDGTSRSGCENDIPPSLPSDYVSEESQPSSLTEQHQRHSDQSFDEPQSDLSNSPKRGSTDQLVFSIVSGSEVSSGSTNDNYTLDEVQSQYQSQSDSYPSLDSSSERLITSIREERGLLPSILELTNSPDTAGTNSPFKRSLSDSGLINNQGRYKQWRRFNSAPMRDGPGLWRYSDRIREIHPAIFRTEEDRTLPLTREYAKDLPSISFGDSGSSSGLCEQSGTTQSSEEAIAETNTSERESVLTSECSTVTINQESDQEDDARSDDTSTKKE